mmetsp:Transcript_17965/g.26919  ORF Transcript_17965/g.26919 Transcript_17965/m.26919 type:complete len:510 (+) Transcript_17965:51-1580(+)
MSSYGVEGGNRHVWKENMEDFPSQSYGIQRRHSRIGNRQACFLLIIALGLILTISPESEKRIGRHTPQPQKRLATKVKNGRIPVRHVKGNGRRKKKHYIHKPRVKIYNADQKFPNCSREKEVSIATFNILQKNFNFSKKPWVLPEHAKWEYRKMLLQDTLATLNTDIVCLQEADEDTFESDFAVYMEQLGYDMVPPSSKNKRDRDHGHTKPSIFFKKDKFMLHWHNPRSRTTLIALEIKSSSTKNRSIFFRESSGTQKSNVKSISESRPPWSLTGDLKTSQSPSNLSVYASSVNEEGVEIVEASLGKDIGVEDISHRIPESQYGQMVYVANCHLQCGGSAGGVNVHHTRTLQMRSALRRMRWHMIRHNIDLHDVALFVCGDFNCPPTDPVCQLLTRGYNTPEEVDNYFKGNDLAFETEIKLKDSHKFLRDSKRKGFPTFVRQHRNTNSSIGLTMDYIFYTNDTMRLEAIRDPFGKNSQRVGKRPNELLPNEWHPSDHFPLVAKFSFAKK